jgi:hypothetical protein
MKDFNQQLDVQQNQKDGQPAELPDQNFDQLALLGAVTGAAGAATKLDSTVLPPVTLVAEGAIAAAKALITHSPGDAVNAARGLAAAAIEVAKNQNTPIMQARKLLGAGAEAVIKKP